jgi:hypothetical protein
MRLVFAALLSLLLAGCGRRGGETKVTPDPSVRGSRPPKEVPAPSPKEARLSLFEGKVIDLEARSILHVLDKDRPSRQAMHGEVGYLVAKSGELRGYDLPTGALRWSIPSAPCSQLAAGEGGAFCGNGADLVRYDAVKGGATAIPSKSTGEISQLLAVSGRILALRNDISIESYDGVTGAFVGASKLPFFPYGSRLGIVANPTGVCGTSPSAMDVLLFCVDSAANILFNKSYPFKKPSDPPSMTFTVQQLDARWMVASTWFSSTPKRGVVVRLSDGVEVARVEKDVAAALSRPDGSLEALLVTRPSLELLEPSGAVRWSSSEKLEDSATALLHDETLVVASFHPIATGADLRGFDRSSGKLLWRGDVELLPIGHSKYFNHVYLSVSFGHVVMRGVEASQHYLELFDPKDGARKFSEVRSVY